MRSICLAHGRDGCGELLDAVVSIGGRPLKFTLFLVLKSLHLFTHGGNGVAQLRCFQRGVVGRLLHSLLLLRVQKLQSSAHLFDGGPQVANFGLGLQKGVGLSLRLHEWLGLDPSVPTG